MIGPLFGMFSAAMFIFFSARFLNMCKPRRTFYLLLRASPPGLAFYGSGLACLLNWLGMINAGWLGSMQSQIFEAVPPNRLLFYLDRPLHVISSLFSHICLFQNVILHKMLKLGFWNFKPIFFRMQFSLVAKLFSLVLVTCLNWCLHLKLSHKF